MMAMEIEATDGRLHVELSGELDADNAPALLRRLTSEHKAPADLMIDIQGLEFIDSSGISGFLKVRDLVVRGGGSFLVSYPNPGVRRVLGIAGLLEVFGLS